MISLIDFNNPMIRTVFPILLQDHTTGENIIWATNSHIDRGEEYAETAEMTEASVLALNGSGIQPRAFKALQAQKDRTKEYAEVFTPSWICKKMNDYADEELAAASFEDYISKRILEICCGEAPFLVSRYDADTGEEIPVADRIGLLDRKLQLIGKKSRKESTWYPRVVKAYQSTYGYEFQGDNLLLARINLLLTFIEFLNDRWKREPTADELHEIANIISWNLWQMDGLTDTIPFGTPKKESEYEMDDVWAKAFGEPVDANATPYCKTYDWDENQPFEYHKVKEGG